MLLICSIHTFDNPGFIFYFKFARGKRYIVSQFFKHDMSIYLNSIMNHLGLNINHKFFKLFIIFITGAVVSVSCSRKDSSFNINSLNYFEKRGLNVFVFNNLYNGLFSDSKISGIEIIHHEVRTATNGDVRLSPTPEQWDPIP